MFRFLLPVILILRIGFAASQALTPASFTVLNSREDEQSPVLSPDGQTMYVTIAHHPGNVGGKRDIGDIWISKLIGGQWSAPINAGPVLNDNNYNAVAGISPDGKQLFLLSHYSAKANTATQGISVSTQTATGWSSPENISVPYFLNRSKQLTGYVDSNSGVFVFAAEGYNTLGAEDIYVTVRNGAGKWSEPKNLGRDINTTYQEQCPWLSADHRYLYFASNGRQGYGSFDIYYSQRIDDTWSNWTEPVNLGSEINSEGRELFYRFYADKGFALYTSTNDSDGYGDIKIFWPPKNVRDSLRQVVQVQPDTIIKLVEVKREKDPGSGEKLVRIYGNVTDDKSNEPVSAKIEFKSDSILSITSGKDGMFSMHVPSVNSYSILVSAPGYIGSVEKLDIRTFEMKELEMNFKLKLAEVGATVNLKNVLFQQSTPNLLDESYDELDMVVDFMRANPKVEIELAGHTDNRGIHVNNVRLSQERVDKVKDYLVEHGIDKKRISGKGYGGIKPIADNDAEVTRRLNRRVEFTIIKN